MAGESTVFTRLSLRTRSNNVNSELYRLSKVYHNSIPLADIDKALTDNGFSATEPAIYCGRDGQSHESVGDGKYLHLSWHRMESGRYEITAYLN